MFRRPNSQCADRALNACRLAAQTFDEMLLLKRGGSVIYNGPLGKQSREMITYFESLPGVDPIGEDYSAYSQLTGLLNPSVADLWRPHRVEAPVEGTALRPCVCLHCSH